MVRQGLLPGPRRAQERLAGRHQEGVPQARAAVPPGREPRQQGRRGAVQGDLGGQRRLVRRGEAGELRPGAGDGRGRVRTGRAGRRWRRMAGRLRRARRRAVRDRRLRHRRSAARVRQRRRPRAAAPTAPAARRRSRDDRGDLVRGGDVRDHRAGAHHRSGRVSHVSRERRGAGHEPDHVSHVRRLGLRQREPGVLLDGAAVPGVPRERPHHRAPVPHVPRLGSGAADAQVPGEDPRGREGRRADQARPSRRARAGRRTARRSVRAGARPGARGVRPQGRQPDAGPAGLLRRRRRWARTSRCPR